VDRWILSAKADDVDGILVASPEGSQVSVERYRTGQFPIETAYAALSKGHSLVLNRLESTWYALAPLIEMLGELFGAQIGVNAYLTPAGSKTFPVHVDLHDAFILQVHGKKVWRLHQLKPQPVQRLRYQQDLEIPGLWGNLESSPLLAELVLRPGDLLYIPRGMPHSAIARDASSFHLTVSINNLYWLDLVKAAVEQACFEAPLLRRGLPPRFLSRPEILGEMRETFSTAMHEFQAKASFEKALQAVMRRTIRRQGYPRDGHMEQLLRLQEIAPDSLMERRPGILCMVECPAGHETCKILFASAAVQGPVRLRAAMEFIRDHDRFQVAELPGLGSESKLVLVRRLVREGLLRLAKAPVTTKTGELARTAS
jgi:ribosomal protein L16 Arg81 hydroxylase